MTRISAANREAARRLRVENIVNGARVRQRLGIGARYNLRSDGQHEVSIGGKLAVGPTLDEAIAKAREQRP